MSQLYLQNKLKTNFLTMQQVPAKLASKSPVTMFLPPPILHYLPVLLITVGFDSEECMGVSLRGDKKHMSRVQREMPIKL